MPYLRKIRKAKWYKSELLPWLSPNDLQADALVDLSTKSNELSVYLVDQDKADLNQVVVALALTCDNLSNVDFALIKEEDLEPLQIKVRQSQGNTPDELVNSRHYDLYEITAQKILALALVIKHSEISRITEPNIKKNAIRALKEKRLDRSRVKLLPDSLKALEEKVEGGK
jgi:hypothetical protein